MHQVAATVESEDFPDAQPESESADPACRIFFSAYGLTPDQFKWLAQNRKKKFQNVCPAPDTSRVDFVIIFTHDVDFYGNTLPGPVHTDKNGFSDFSPMTMLDTTVTPLSQAEKARREYVYVFTMKRGAFDPARFSPRRRYQFTFFADRRRRFPVHGGARPEPLRCGEQNRANPSRRRSFVFPTRGLYSLAAPRVEAHRQREDG